MCHQKVKVFAYGLKLNMTYRLKTDVNAAIMIKHNMCFYIKDVDVYTIHVNFTHDFTGQ